MSLPVAADAAALLTCHRDAYHTARNGQRAVGLQANHIGPAHIQVERTTLHKNGAIVIAVYAVASHIGDVYHTAIHLEIIVGVIHLALATMDAVTHCRKHIDGAHRLLHL